MTPPLDRLREYRCPDCHALLGSSTRKKLTLGTPFIECTCGTYAPRPLFSEWDMLDPPAKANFLMRGTAWVLAGTIPGHEVEHPMAVVILGGLFTSTLLNLFVMPALYLRFARPMTQPAPVKAS